MNVVLIGSRAAGKTTVGRRLSFVLARPFVDTDDLIEKRQGIAIAEIVKVHGWDYFRAIEREVISEISRHDDLIIAPGGGAVIGPENVAALKRKGLLIWLRADTQVLLERISKDPRTLSARPSLTGRGTLEELKEILTEREGSYEKASDLQVDTSELDVDGVAKSVVSIFKKNAGEAQDGRKFLWNAL